MKLPPALHIVSTIRLQSRDKYARTSILPRCNALLIRYCAVQIWVKKSCCDAADVVSFCDMEVHVRRWAVIVCCCAASEFSAMSDMKHVHVTWDRHHAAMDTGNDVDTMRHLAENVPHRKLKSIHFLDCKANGCKTAHTLNHNKKPPCRPPPSRRQTDSKSGQASQGESPERAETITFSITRLLRINAMHLNDCRWRLFIIMQYAAALCCCACHRACLQQPLHAAGRVRHAAGRVRLGFASDERGGLLPLQERLSGRANHHRKTNTR
jgi:hypothetical protein